MRGCRDKIIKVWIQGIKLLLDLEGNEKEKERQTVSVCLEIARKIEQKYLLGIF